MSEVFNDFGFSTVSEEDFAATQQVEVDRDKEVATTATASIKPELETIEAKISSLAENMRTFKDDLDDRKEELNDKWKGTQRMKFRKTISSVGKKYKEWG